MAFEGPTKLLIAGQAQLNFDILDLVSYLVVFILLFIKLIFLIQ